MPAGGGERADGRCSSQNDRESLLRDLLIHHKTETPAANGDAEHGLFNVLRPTVTVGLLLHGELLFHALREERPECFRLAGRFHSQGSKDFTNRLRAVIAEL